jgi:cytosine/adenosine deaminase-related metal-dependent hydrolase
LAGAASEPDSTLAHAVFAAAAGDVSHVVVGGELIVDDGRHLRVPDVPGALAAALATTRAS